MNETSTIHSTFSTTLALFFGMDFSKAYDPKVVPIPRRGSVLIESWALLRNHFEIDRIASITP